jgi:hypothetical protein
MEAIESQNTRIKEYLLKGKSLTAIEALHYFNCFRLSARIQDLEEQGLIIDSERVTVTSDGKTKWFSRYKLVK